MARTRSRLRRVRDFVWWAMERMEPRCYFCGKRIPTEAFLVGDVRDGILLHHVRMDRNRTEADGLEPAHRGCNKSFHRNWEERSVDIRTAEAVRRFGPTPRVKSTRVRRHGYVRDLAV